MKKFFLLILLIFPLFLAGCDISFNAPKQQTQADNKQSAVQVQAGNEQLEVTDNKLENSANDVSASFSQNIENQVDSSTQEGSPSFDLNKEAALIADSGFSQAGLDALLKYNGAQRDNEAMAENMKMFDQIFKRFPEASINDIYSVNNFLTYGTPSTEKLLIDGRSEMFGKYLNSDRKIPTGLTEWEKILNISIVYNETFDDERLAEIRNIQTALELYFDKFNFYPPTTVSYLTPDTNLSDNGFSTTTSGTIYMRNVGKAKVPLGKDCREAQYYSYKNTGTSSYELKYCMDADGKVYTATQKGIK